MVNEDVILRSEVDLAVSNISRQMQAQNPGQLPPRDVLERQVLERLILMRLQVERAESSGIRISDQELQQAIGTVASQNKMTVDELRQRLADWQVNEGWFANAHADARFMHCLPVRRNVAVADALLDSARSVVLREAYNRMPAQMAVLHRLLAS